MPFLPLNGPEAYDARGKLKPAKAPSVSKWQAPDYPGVDRNYGGWVGLRTDGLVVIDCDSDTAVEAWRAIGDETFEVKTPRGTHFYYKWSPGSPLGPSVDVLPGTDVRAGNTSQVVVPPTPGYEEMGGEVMPFDPSWLPVKPAPEDVLDQGWDVIPEGRRNVTLTAIAGSLRKQGAGPEMMAATLATINKHRCIPPLPDDEIVTIIRSVLRYAPDPFDPDGEIEILGEDGEPVEKVNWKRLNMSDMTLPPPANWLWQPYLPEGRLVLLDGAEGIGKGLFCAFATANVTSGGWGDEPRPVLWFSAEDDPVEDVQRRLLAAGYVQGENEEVTFIEGMPRFPRDMTDLIGEMKGTQYGLVILDPGRSFLGPEGDYTGPWSYNDEAAVRPGLEQLNRVAKAAGVTIIFVHHWNKDTQASIENRSAGSKAFRQVVRHGISMAWVGDTETGQGAIAVTKSNIGPTGHLRGYTIKPSPPELATATFDMGEPLADYRMSDFLRRMNDELNGDVYVELDLDTIMAGLTLTPGNPFPNARAIHNYYKGHGMGIKDAQNALNAAVDAGYVRKEADGVYTYVGLPELEAGTDA